MEPVVSSSHPEIKLICPEVELLDESKHYNSTEIVKVINKILKYIKNHG